MFDRAGPGVGSARVYNTDSAGVNRLRVLPWSQAKTPAGNYPRGWFMPARRRRLCFGVCVCVLVDIPRAVTLVVYLFFVYVSRFL